MSLSVRVSVPVYEREREREREGEGENGKCEKARIFSTPSQLKPQREIQEKNKKTLKFSALFWPWEKHFMAAGHLKRN